MINFIRIQLKNFIRTQLAIFAGKVIGEDIAFHMEQTRLISAKAWNEVKSLNLIREKDCTCEVCKYLNKTFPELTFEKK